MAEVSKKSNDRVDVFVPLGSTKDVPYVLVGVNGKLMQLPRGKTSSVPKEFAEEYFRSQRALAAYTEKQLRNRYVEQGQNDPLRK